MAPIEASPNSRAIAAWPNVLAAVFVVLMFVSLRVLEDTTQKIGLVLAWLSYAGMIVGRLRGRFAADADGKRLLLLVGGPGDAFLLFGAALCEWAVLGSKAPALALPAGVLLFFVGAALILALELAAQPMRATGFVDNRRVQSAARTACTLVFAAAGLSALCYGVEKLDLRRDFSFASPSAPSAATLSVLDTATCPAGDAKDGTASPAAAGKPELFLFFERGSPGLAVVEDYYRVLGKAGARVTTLDAAADPALSKQLKISKNGTVGFRCGGRTDTWSVGDDREEAERKVAKMDEETRTRLAKLTKDAVNVYMTVGHGERDSEDFSKPGQRTSAKNMKKLVEIVNGKTKKLGMADGLSSAVPADAALVVVMGPTAPFQPGEANALANYVKGGGSLLLMIDPKVGDQADVVASLEPLLVALNVKVGEHEVLNDKAFVSDSHSDADHAFLYSTSFGSHKSVKTLSSFRGKANLLFQSVTNIDKRDTKIPDPRVAMVVHSAPNSWLDANDDRKWDDKAEPRGTFDFAAAVEIGKPGDKEGRAMVVGDSDVLADSLLVSEANQAFGYDAMLWLLRDDDKVSAEGVKPDEDVKILHTRDEDTVWFYATTFAGPVIAIAGGLGYVRFKRRRRKGGAA